MLFLSLLTASRRTDFNKTLSSLGKVGSCHDAVCTWHKLWAGKKLHEIQAASLIGLCKRMLN